MRVLLLASIGDEAERIADFCRRAFDDVEAVHGDWGQAWPEHCTDWVGDLIVSYCSRWIVPARVIGNASLAALNFHPAPPRYRGVGGINWALYNSDPTYGVTCHHMVAKVDAGPIVAVNEFHTCANDTVDSLYRRTHATQEALAYQVLGLIAAGSPIPVSSQQWGDTVKTKKELNALSEIQADMSHDEVARRVRATHFGPWKPTISAGGHTFELMTD